ncbi:efflux RND transporter periplasmic adaptor subunit, partial [Staphylococcus succinus]
MKKVIMICAILAIITTMLIFYIIYFKTQLSSTNTSIETIKITYNKPFIFVGKKVPSKIASIAYDKNKGYINDWFVKSNDKIKKNQVLFEYYNPSIEQQITAKQKQLFHLKQNKGSHLNLLKQEMLKLQADIQQLQNQLRIKVYAPETGTIYINNHSPSQNEDIVLHIYNSKMLIKAAVPESIIE